MAKQSGLGDRLLINGVNVSGDIGSIGTISGGPAALEVTGIDKTAFERIGGLRDGTFEYSAYFNPDGAHPSLSVLPAGATVHTYCRGLGLGSAAACIRALQTNYDPTRGNDGALTIAVSCNGEGFGLEWGEQLVADLDALTGPGNGPALDAGASTAHGLQAYLQVLGVTGTSVTVKLQDSPDGTTWADVAGGAFVAATGPGAQRIQTARALTVARRLRLVTSGTFTAATVHVVVVRNPVAVNV